MEKTDESKKCLIALSETKHSFAVPKTTQKPATRAKRLEQFFWQEINDEYLRQTKPVESVEIPEAKSEYFDEYCKEVPPEAEEYNESLTIKYPLYCSTAITLWNHEGDSTKTFKKKYSITRPLQECTEKFGQ